MFPSLHPQVCVSADSGLTFSDISGTLASQSGLDETSAVTFADAQHGWVAIRRKIELTTNAGTTWTTVDAQATTNALHAMDTQRVVRIGDSDSISHTTNGGQTWAAATVPAAGANYQKMFWLDAQRGWATAQVADSNMIASQALVMCTRRHEYRRRVPDPVSAPPQAAATVGDNGLAALEGSCGTLAQGRR